jgi:hypothetical protein
VVHGDLHEEQLYVDKSKIVAVTGWSNLHIGDPAEDLGWLLALEERSTMERVVTAYVQRRATAADSHLLDRATLHAEFALARWLARAVTRNDAERVAQAEALLAELDTNIAELGDLPIGVVEDARPAETAGTAATSASAASAPSASSAGSSATSSASASASEPKDKTSAASDTEPEKQEPKPSANEPGKDDTVITPRKTLDSALSANSAGSGGSPASADSASSASSASSATSAASASGDSASSAPDADDDEDSAVITDADVVSDTDRKAESPKKD